MTNEETIRLALEITHTQTVRDAVLELQKMGDAAKLAGNHVEALKLETLQYKLAIDAESNALDQELTAMVKATQAQQAMARVLEETATATTKAGVGSTGFGRGVLGMQYAVDDFMAVYQNQGFGRAIAAMQNNIPQIALALGAGGGLTAAIGFAALAAGAAIPWFQGMIGALGSDEIKKAKDELEAFAKKIDEFNAMAGKPTRAEAAGAKIIGDALLEGDEQTIARAAARALGKSGRGAQPTPGEEAELADPVIAAMQGGPEAVRANLKKRLDAENLKQVQHAIASMGEPGEAGRKARGLLSPLVAADPGAFPPGFLGDIERSDPADVKRQQGLEDQGALNVENMVRADKERKQKENDAAKAAQARLKARRDKILGDAKFFDEKDKEEAAGAKGEQDVNAEAFDRFHRQMAMAKKVRLANEQQEKKGEQEAKKAQHREDQQAAHRLQTEAQQLERGYQDEMGMARAMNATADVIAEINRRHTFLKRRLEDAGNRMKEDMMQGNDP